MKLDRHFARRRWLTAYAPLLIWTIVVLGLGSSLGAMNETSLFVRPLLEFLFPSAPPETLIIYHGYVRKSAHLVEYAILAILARRAFDRFSKPTLISIGLVAIVAALDEFRQSFEPRRTGAFADILLDLSGGLLGLVTWWVVWARSKRASSPREPVE